MSQVYAFTGIPGTGVQQAIEKLKLAEGFPAKIVCLDQYLWDSFAQDARSNPELLRQTELKPEAVAPGEKPNWWKILRLPISAIRFYWGVGAERALQEIENSNDEIFFLTLHACYHSDYFRWRLSAVDPAILSKFKVRAFYTLIDDVYDIHSRRRDDVSAQRMAAGREEDDEWERARKLIEYYIKYLDQLIRWRQEEIVLTDLFAAAACVPSHVFSVKHPIRTLAKLIQNPTFSYYFSHPITAVRREENFTKGSHYEEIREVSTQLRLITSLIEPTTIDELRIQAKSSNGDLTHLPKLNPRWPLLDEIGNLLYTPPNNAPTADDNLYGSDSAELLGLNEKCTELAEGRGPESTQALVSSDVKNFAYRVSEDITWRDHHLVDQTKRIVVFRPMLNGTKSLGVQKELEYYAKLSLTGAPTHGCIVVHPPEDGAMRNAAVGKTIIETWKEHPEIGPNLRPRLNRMSAPQLEALSDSIAKVISSSTDPRIGADAAVQELSRFVQFEPPINPPTPLSPGPTSTAMSRADEVRQRTVQVAQLVIKNENYVNVLRHRSDLGLVFVETKKALLDRSELRSE